MHIDLCCLQYCLDVQTALNKKCITCPDAENKTESRILNWKPILTLF